MSIVKCTFTETHALSLLSFIQEAEICIHASDNNAFSDENMQAVTSIKNDLLFKLSIEASAAIQNILSNTENVTEGNGVSANGEMYDDVKHGLLLAQKLLELHHG